MVIEFEPKPKLPPSVDKPVVPKKPVEADGSDLAPAPNPARPKAGRKDKDMPGKNGELF